MHLFNCNIIKSNAFTTPEPIKEEESSHKICFDHDLLSESDKDSDSEIERQLFLMFAFVENDRKRKLEEVNKEEVYSPPSMAYRSISFRVSEDHRGDLTSEDMHQWEDTYHMLPLLFSCKGFVHSFFVHWFSHFKTKNRNPNEPNGSFG